MTPPHHGGHILGRLHDGVLESRYALIGSTMLVGIVMVQCGPPQAPFRM